MINLVRPSHTLPRDLEEQLGDPTETDLDERGLGREGASVCVECTETVREVPERWAVKEL